MAYGKINVSGGTVGTGFDAFNGSVINGGTMGDYFTASLGSTLYLRRNVRRR
jgi:hypothetical protein